MMLGQFYKLKSIFNKRYEYYENLMLKNSNNVLEVMGKMSVSFPLNMVRISL